jgi:N-carbamoyl-L-amino-acid hydrolase
MVGALAADYASGLTDDEGVSMAEASGLSFGSEPDRVSRIGEFVELHIEQGRLPHTGGNGLDVPVGLATEIWPHGRWRVDLTGQQNHAGTTPMRDRDDPMQELAYLILDVRQAALREDALATVGKLQVHPGAVNAIPGRATAWIDARGADEERVRRVIDGFDAVEESWTAVTRFSLDLSAALGEVPHLPSGAGHDAGVLALAGIPSAMIMVRNPTGISHSPLEEASDDDVLAGIDALVAVLRARA